MAGRESRVIPDESLTETQFPRRYDATSAGMSSGGATFVAMVQAADLAECHDHAVLGGWTGRGEGGHQGPRLSDQ
jgi:hypothetical protein